MIRVSKVMTQDGKLHANEKEAKRHAEAVYGQALTKLAAQALTIVKYTPMCQWIEDNIFAFVALHALKLDFEIVSDAEDD